MKRKIIIITTLAIGLLIASYFIFFNKADAKESYTFGELTEGDLNVVITSSGTLEATSTVDVGTQVSGKITRLYVDFNSEVKKGQLLAVLDTVNLVEQVSDAQANLAKVKAEYNQKLVIHERNKILFEKKYISELDYTQSQTDVEASLASYKSAQSALERAKTNLSYAYIYAPIAGKIIDRSVEEGQTVAASFSAPTLFTIAQDLSSMRILASVDESDIGQIKEGQKVSFTVQAYSDKTFEGTVTQIRLNATVASNVVNYVVVINSANPDKLLLPGMTATVDFYVEQRENILLIPNTALRFEPSDEMAEEIKKNMTEEMASVPDSIKNKFRNGPPQGGLPPTGMQMPPNGMTPPNSVNGGKVSMSKVYYLDSNGKLKMTMVMTGLTDGKNTEVVMSRNLKSGMKVITGLQDVESTSTKKSSNPLNQNQGGPGAGGPPPMMM
jgi:HlyD family secretion protein